MRRNLPQNENHDLENDVVEDNVTENNVVENNVVPLNDAGAVFDALAQEIKGSAVGWPPGALDKLELALLDRYGHLIGGASGVKRLLLLAQEPSAA